MGQPSLTSPEPLGAVLGVRLVPEKKGICKLEVEAGGGLGGGEGPGGKEACLDPNTSHN